MQSKSAVEVVEPGDIDNPREELKTLNEFLQIVISHRQKIGEIRYAAAHTLLECLRFIKLNKSYIEYIINHYKNPASFPTRADYEHQVFRCHNDIAIHFGSYVAKDDPDAAGKAWLGYSHIVEIIEEAFIEYKKDPRLLLAFIKSFNERDPNDTCLDARVSGPRGFIERRRIGSVRDLVGAITEARVPVMELDRNESFERVAKYISEQDLWEKEVYVTQEDGEPQVVLLTYQNLAREIEKYSYPVNATTDQLRPKRWYGSPVAIGLPAIRQLELEREGRGH